MLQSQKLINCIAKNNNKMKIYNNLKNRLKICEKIRIYWNNKLKNKFKSQINLKMRVKKI